MEEVKNAIHKAIKNLWNIEVDVVLSRPDKQFGDVSSNVALQIQHQCNESPREIAQKIVAELGENGHFTKIDIAGPGFINLTLADSFLFGILNEEDGTEYADKTIVIETNNPNPFKAMHIGHAFNAIIADTIANLLEAGGAVVNRVSYHGDVGSHVGKSMYSLLLFADGDIQKIEQIPKDHRNSFMSEMYAKGAKAYKEDEAAKAKINELAKQSYLLEDTLYAEIYKLCKNWSFEQIKDLVNRLGNKAVDKQYLESDVQAPGVEIVKKNKKYFVESEGALVFPGSKYGSFDNVFVASNGYGLYGARDLGLIKAKNDDYHPQKSYIVTAEEQRDYFKGVISAAQLCMPNVKDVTVNIATGTVRLTTGKMSSRNGEVVEVEWLLEQIHDAIKNRGAKPTKNVVVGAIRYEFLKTRVGSDVIFDINDAASISGNSGPYLQYAHARACAILCKSSINNDEFTINALDKNEHILLLKLSEYNEQKNRAITELMPHHLCTYLFELTQVFNSFYEKSRVIGDDREAIRIRLVKEYKNILASGLAILCIPAPEKM